MNDSRLMRSAPLQRRAPLRNRKPMPRVSSPLARARTRDSRGPGLAQRVAMASGTAPRHRRGESDLLRSEAHRRNVASLPCVATGIEGSSQAAHANFGKGMGIKVCDSLCFPLSPDAHRAHDQGGMPRAERWRLEWEYLDWTRAELLQRNQWPRSVEAHYQRAIAALRRVCE